MSNLPPAWAMPPTNEAEQRQPQPQQQPPPSYQQPPYQTNQSMANPGITAGPPPPSVTPPSSAATAAVAPSVSSAQATTMPKSRLEQRMESKILSCRTPDQETEQGLVRNEEAIRKIRDSWIYKNIRARTNEFTDFKQVRNDGRKKIKKKSYVFVVLIIL
jgi:hypothetical protein